MKQKGFAPIILFPIFLLITAVWIAGYFTSASSENKIPIQNILNQEKQDRQVENVAWQFERGKGWTSTGNPPECPSPLEISSPVDVSKATGILYPGQIRGGDYKPHGGFRFDNNETNNVEVRAVMDGYLLKAAKYDDGYAVQIQIFYVNDCGIMAMNDHLLTLSPKLENALSVVPVKEGDSRTTNIESQIYLEEGDLIATKVGYEDFPGGKNGRNIFVDLGLYDLRQTNGVDYEEGFRENHPNIDEYGTHALCWLNYLPPEEQHVVNSLPAGGVEGKTSDYCK